MLDIAALHMYIIFTSVAHSYCKSAKMAESIVNSLFLDGIRD